MPIASGFSIQRNDILDVSHRTQKEIHSAISGSHVYQLRSKPDFIDKDWEWDIRLGENRIYLDRTKGVNLFGGGLGSSTEQEAWDSDIYEEGSTTSGEGSVKYDTAIGEFGSIVFNQVATPITGEKLEITYIEHMDNFTGNDGGLLFQLAHDMCVHPYDSPEIFKGKFSNAATLKVTNVAGTSGDPITNGIDSTSVQGLDGDNLLVFRNDLSVRFNHDYSVDGTAATQRDAAKLWKQVVEHRETASVNMSSSFGSIDPTNPTTYVTLMNDFPLCVADLGSGEFRVSINGRVLPSDDYVITSDTSLRTTEFKLKRNPTTAPMTWVSDLANTQVVISYHWAKSLDVPFGALVGPTGMSPDQEGITPTGAGTPNPSDLSWPHNDGSAKDYWVFSKAVMATPATTSINAFVGWGYNSSTNVAHIVEDQAGTGNQISLASNTITSGNLGSRVQNLVTVSDSDNWYLSFLDNSEFTTPFSLIYPTPVSNSKGDVKNALRRITDKFLVESDKGVDLLSDTNLSFVNSYQIAGNRKPQKWRMRFEWNYDDFALKVHVATSYQLKDDMKVSETAGRDGIKSPVFREPGELCDVYEAPSIGRGSILKMNTAKSQWFRKVQVTDDVSATYPMSYRMTITNHGMGLFLFNQASTDQDDDYAWLVVQRHVDQTSGQPEYTEKSPVHCVYSPSKRPVDVSSLNQYFASNDLDDLSKPGNITSSLGGIFKTEAPTIFVDNTGSFFNGTVNAVDFNSFGYAGSITGSSVAALQADIKSDLYRGFTSASGTNTTNLWSEPVHEFNVDMSATNTIAAVAANNLRPGVFIVNGDPNITPPAVGKGGRIKSIDLSTGRMIVSTYENLTNFADQAGTPGQDPYTATLKIGTSASGDVSSGDFSQFSGSNTITISSGPGSATASAQALSTHPINDLQILGFTSLPRRRNTSIAMGGSKSPAALVRDGSASPNTPVDLFETDKIGGRMSGTTTPAAGWAIGSDFAPSISRNIIFPEPLLSRMSTFKAAATNSTTGVPPVPDPVSISDYKSGDSALLDILYTAQPSNIDKVFESLIVAIDDMELKRDKGAYVLSYDEWVQEGDPSTVERFLESLDAAGVVNLGADFKLPAVDGSVVPTLFSVAPVGGVVTIDTGVTNSSTGRIFFSERGGASNNATYSIQASMMVTSGNKSLLANKMPGDIIWSPSMTGSDNTKNEYCYDFMNKTLFFKYPPASGASFSIQMVNYQTSNPSQETYIISTPEDRNMPERNMDNVKTINRFVVREQDVFKPWDYHVSATMHEIDSHAIINPQEQLSITQDRNFVFSFPTQITSQRFYYPQSEMDIICVSSADFSTQAGHVEINKYGDSDGLNGTFDQGNYIPSGITGDEQTRYAGHLGPDGEKYVWRKAARKYEGMMSTMPNGNGMRIFMQVTGSSIRYSDVTSGKLPGSTVGT